MYVINTLFCLGALVHECSGRAVAQRFPKYQYHLNGHSRILRFNKHTARA